MPSAIEARIDAGIDAEAQKKVAKESIMHAQQILHACGGYGIADLQHAVALIEAITDPWAQGAAQAQQLVHQLVHRCPTDAKKTAVDAIEMRLEAAIEMVPNLAEVLRREPVRLRRVHAQAGEQGARAREQDAQRVQEAQRPDRTQGTF